MEAPRLRIGLVKTLAKNKEQIKLTNHKIKNSEDKMMDGSFYFPCLSFAIIYVTCCWMGFRPRHWHSLPLVLTKVANAIHFNAFLFHTLDGNETCSLVFGGVGVYLLRSRLLTLRIYFNLLSAPFMLMLFALILFRGVSV